MVLVQKWDRSVRFYVSRCLRAICFRRDIETWDDAWGSVPYPTVTVQEAYIKREDAPTQELSDSRAALAEAHRH